MKGLLKRLYRSKKNRVILIGLDGVPYSLVRDLAEKGVAENIKELIDKGVFKRMSSSIPEVSSVAWSSIITGKNPGVHGIFGFTDIPIGTYRLSFPNFNDLKTKPYWMKEGVGRSVIINVPSTFPVKPLDGVHISGFVSLDLDRSVHPKSLIPKLIELGYRIDVDSSKAHSSMELFLKDLDETLRARIDAYRYLWKSEKWENFWLVFTGTDRLFHFLWDAYKDENHRYHPYFLEYFRRIDGVIGEILEKIKGEDLLIILSDHGFGPLEREININFLLKETGFLRLRPGTKGDLTDIEYGTKAFALDPSRIYINLKNKYPRGSVGEDDYNRVVEDLINLFEELEVKGKKVIKRIFRKEEIYHGPLIHKSPDLVLLPNPGFDLKANIKATSLENKGIFTGKHTQEDAFLLINQRLDIIPNDPSVWDVCGVINRFRLLY